MNNCFDILASACQEHVKLEVDASVLGDPIDVGSNSSEDSWVWCDCARVGKC